MTDRGTYETLRDTFRWDIPERYNIAVDTIDRHAAARPDDLALIFEDEAGAIERFSFEDVRLASNRLANVLVGLGHAPGDRVAILLPQAPETAIAHVAAYRAGFIAVPLFVLFGPEAIEYRLADSGATALITDLADWPKVAEIRDRLPGSADDHRGRRRGSGWDARLRGGHSRGRRHVPDRRQRGRRPGDHHLHLGHDRPAQGRAARPSLPARSHPRRRCSRRSSRRSRATSSGRRPTGRGSVACTTSSSRPGTGASRSWPTGRAGSTLNGRST